MVKFSKGIGSSRGKVEFPGGVASAGGGGHGTGEKLILGREKSLSGPISPRK